MRRWIHKGLLAMAAVLTAVLGLSTGCATFGGSAEGARLDRVSRSPRFGDGVFENTVRTPAGLQGSVWSVARDWVAGKQVREPRMPPPTRRQSAEAFASAPKSGLRMTWMGHSTALVEIDGARILTDPVWSERVSPSTLVGPKRFHAPPVALEDLPPLDAVIISHDHYDHLDHPTIVALAATGARFVVPLGVGAHLEHWGVPAAQTVELDWWERHTLESGVTLVATPARHFSGRSLTDRNETLWASWAIRGPKHRVWFGGDTGMFPGLTEIGLREGPFDATLVPIGAYNDAWQAVHLNPEEAVLAHRMVRGGVFVPVHWGTFNLALHDWYEPAERLIRAAATSGVQVALPMAGQPFEPEREPLPRAPWWRPPFRS